MSTLPPATGGVAAGVAGWKGGATPPPPACGVENADDWGGKIGGLLSCCPDGVVESEPPV